MKFLLAIFGILTYVSMCGQSKGVKELQAAKSNLPTSTYAVVVGISDYQDPGIPDLKYADKDAEAFANFLRSPAGGNLDNEHLIVLTNENATAGRVAEALDGLLEKTKEGEQVIIYFSGHGDVERKTVSQPGFLLCWDSPSRVYMGGGTYSLAYLQEVVTTLSTQNKAKVIVVTDACHAGKLSGSQIGGAQLTAANLARQFANEVKILSCQPGELSLEGEQWGGGRGCFSYHLVEGLYGLADRNSDGYVSAGELDRYIEDQVSSEAAPQSQVPMLIGNKTDQLSKVNKQILEDLIRLKNRQMAVFAATESRGQEEEVLTKLDSTTQKLYHSFKEAMKEKRFFEPEGNCAEYYFFKLSSLDVLAPLQRSMRRNYAAVLQDDAQQVINIWQAADVQQLNCIGKSLKMESIPRQLARAAELLGESHYMYKSLLARKFLFEGIVLAEERLDEKTGRAALKKYELSLALEPNSPHSWHRMALIYAGYLNQPDSAFICADAAKHLAPNWVLPYVDLANYLSLFKKYELADKALQVAEAIDSLHAYTINRRGMWHLAKGDVAKAISMMEKYTLIGGPTYPCWHNNYGNLLLNISKYKEAEEEFLKAISLDSTTVMAWNNLGSLYIRTRRLPEAEHMLLKAFSLDSSLLDVINNLGAMYRSSNRPEKAMVYFKKAISLDSTNARYWSNLGSVYIDMKKFEEAEKFVERANVVDSTYIPGLLNRGSICRETGRWDCAKQYYEKALSINPGFAMTYLNYAALESKRGNAAAAASYAEQAILKGLKFKDYYIAEAFTAIKEEPAWKELLKKYFPDQFKEK